MLSRIRNGHGKQDGKLLIVLVLFVFVFPSSAYGQNPRQPLSVGYPSFESPHAAPIAIHGDRVFVVNTPASTLDVIDRTSKKIVARIRVGVEPVSVAVRPDGREVWVTNHISDSVSVIDNQPSSETDLQVVATVQEFDAKTRATRFDEPVGIAFAGNDKAYVALSSENQIAVVDVVTRKVTKRLAIRSQDPRAILVRGNRLFVIPFESNNKTQLSGGSKIDGDLVTFNAWEHSIRVNNVLSLGHVIDIVKHPKVPDRDLFIFDTQTDTLVETVDTLGTLLYGLTVASNGQVFIAQTDARNDANGRSGSKKHGLKELENRPFLNRITKVAFEAGKAKKPQFFDLEPLPPHQPKAGEGLATPFAIQVSDDDKTLVVSAAASDVLFTVDAASGTVLGRVAVGAGPRGIALDSHPKRGLQAWVLNALANTVSLVDLSRVSQPNVLTTITLSDPTQPAFKRGRIAFNSASASTTGTFACASCHPDGHTDQLLWVLQTPIVSGGDQIMPRSTMPVRGLRDTAPFHWDGIPGDPYGGINSASIRKAVPANSHVGDERSSPRHLINGALATTMHEVGNPSKNDEGLSGALSAAERDDMALYLLGVPYPPAPGRSYTDQVSERARKGFELFHIEGDHDPKQVTPNVCGNCHRMPFLVSTNTPGTGMDAPTWRGAHDRWLILPQGRLNIIDFDFYRWVAEQGIPERKVWQFSWSGRTRFDPIWEMVLEMGTGFSGSFARQITLNARTAAANETGDLLRALERSAADGAIVLEADGVLLNGQKPKRLALQFDPQYLGGRFVQKEGKRTAYSHKELQTLAAKGEIICTVTARHGARATVDDPQPAIWTLGPIERQRGRQDFPILHSDQLAITLSGRHFQDNAQVFIDGRRVPARVQKKEGETVVITLSEHPAVGMHLLQVQVPEGMFSNEFLFHYAQDAESARNLKRERDAAHLPPQDVLSKAIASGDLKTVKARLKSKEQINIRFKNGGASPLNTAALYGRLEIVRYLIENGADVSFTNTDGNTALHAAAFFCRTEIVKLLLENGASLTKKNNRGESSIDVVSGEWNQGLADFYNGLASGLGLTIDLKQIETDRSKMAKLLKGD